MVGHVSPEAYCGGNIALIQNGDIITIDAVNKTLSVVCILCTVLLNNPIISEALSKEELSERRKQWTPIDKPVKGLLLKYRRSVATLAHCEMVYS